MTETSQEDIEKQHNEAVRLVKEGFSCLENVNHGEISLMFKRHPTELDPASISMEDEEEELVSIGVSKPADESEVPCFSSRGMVDVTPIVQLINEGYNEKLKTTLTVIKKPSGSSKSSNNNQSKLPSPSSVSVKSLSNLWDLNNAFQNNVHIVRPSHDKWGIKKIMLIFCDDFLRDVHEMPWWHGNTDTSTNNPNAKAIAEIATKMRAAIQPIFDTLNIPAHRVVRMLFAALPPGITIPIHHDTGEWVKHTHRVHVPVIVSDPNSVLFRCGLTDTKMNRISVEPGHVFELNNQGKHAVSNCSNDHRVHLILDYVDESFPLPTRVPLAPGERLLQTRRSIDRESDHGKRPTPSYMILGCQKSGTTSLYDYLNQHPLVVKARRRETHCLDWRWNETLESVEDQRRNCCTKFYYYDELQNHPSLLTGDSSPSYILHSDLVVPRLKRVFPWPIKFFVMLRDPVKRCKSHYHMVTAEDGTEEQKMHRGTDWLNKTFEQVVQDDFQLMQQVGLIPYWKEETCTVDQAVFDAFVGSTEELHAWSMYQRHIPMMKGSHSPVARGIYHLQLRCWFNDFPREDFMVIQLEWMKSNKDIQRIVGRAFEHLGLPPVAVKDASAKNTRSYDALKIETKHMLENFYAPHNEVLHRLLGETWSEAWPCEEISNE